MIHHQSLPYSSTFDYFLIHPSGSFPSLPNMKRGSESYKKYLLPSIYQHSFPAFCFQIHRRRNTERYESILDNFIPYSFLQFTIWLLLTPPCWKSLIKMTMNTKLLNNLLFSIYMLSDLSIACDSLTTFSWKSFILLPLSHCMSSLLPASVNHLFPIS